MFRCKIEQGIIFRNLIDVINQIFSDIEFKIAKTGIFINSMNVHRDIFLNLNFSVYNFKEFICDENITLKIDLGIFSKVLKNITNEDSLILEEDAKNQKLKVIIQGKYKRSYSLPLLEETISISFKENKRPQFKNPNKFSINLDSDKFNKILKELQKTKGSFISFITEDQKFKIGCYEGDYEGIFDVENIKDGQYNGEIKINTDYILKASRAYLISDNVEIEFNDEGLLHLLYKIYNDDRNGTLEYYIASMQEEEYEEEEEEEENEEQEQENKDIDTKSEE